VQLPRKAYEGVIDMIWLDVVSKADRFGLITTALAGYRMRFRSPACPC
jgi:hypothetical protein